MKGRVAVVTGAASGLGAAIAAALRDQGMRVAGLDLNPSDTDLSLQVDVTHTDQVGVAIRRVESELGPIDVLVTAAGIYEMLEIEDITDERWDRMLGINLAGNVTVCAAVLPLLVARGSGSVVTISSDLGIGGSQGDVHYATTKGAIVALTRSLAQEVAPSGVAVNTVAPGAADTPMLAADSPWRAREFLDTLPIQRVVPAEEIAAAVLFLVDAGTSIIGQVVSPNSGATI